MSKGVPAMLDFFFRDEKVNWLLTAGVGLGEFNPPKRRVIIEN
jgi:hypothetical protein